MWITQMFLGPFSAALFVVFFLFFSVAANNPSSVFERQGLHQWQKPPQKNLIWRSTHSGLSSLWVCAAFHTSSTHNTEKKKEKVDILCLNRHGNTCEGKFFSKKVLILLWTEFITTVIAPAVHKMTQKVTKYVCSTLLLCPCYFWSK